MAAKGKTSAKKTSAKKTSAKNHRMKAPAKKKAVATAKTTAAKATVPVRKPPAPGLLGKTLAQKLKAARPGTSDEAVIMDTLRSVPQDQLKASLNQASAKERNAVFIAIPANQIKSIIETASAGFLSPAGPPPPPPPTPNGGPPASILTTTYTNVEYPPAQRDPNWSKKFTNGDTITLGGPTEWVSVYDPGAEKEGGLNNPMVGVTGWAVNAALSGGDVTFVHPFDWDFEYYIVPDPQYASLLAATNTFAGATDGDYKTAVKAANAIGLTAAKGSPGVLGVESDRRLIPDAFQNLLIGHDGARVASFGRWIVDCGHDDFHTEIHAPLLMAVATPAPPPAGVRGASQMTSLQIMSRPYTVSQKFPEGNFVDHLLVEVAKVEDTTFGIPHSFRVEAHPTVFTTPYEGRPYIKLLVQPPQKPKVNPVVPPPQLMVSFHFTHRTGVAVRVFDAGNGTVGIIIVLGDLNPAKLPRKNDRTVGWSELGAKYGYVIDALQIADLLTLDIASAIVLQRGILTDLYDPPSASSPVDNQNVATSVSIGQLQATAGVSEYDDQPFPIYGWLNVWWQTQQAVVEA